MIAVISRFLPIVSVVLLSAMGLYYCQCSMAYAAPEQSVLNEPTNVHANGVVDRQGWTDVDQDGIPDSVEEALCGSATCARPNVDSDSDGIPDWVEYLACGSATCATPADSNKDCIPDYVSLILCGDQSCSQSAIAGDDDNDGIPNWIEVVVSGTWHGATGMEDYNDNSQPDTTELMACSAEVNSGGSTSDPRLDFLGFLSMALCCAGICMIVRKRVAR